MAHPIKHFFTITKHRHLVMHYCFKLGIGFQGLFHDLSKYTPSEFIPGAKYYTGYCSPTALERKKLGYSKAWLHHKGHNKHHYEYWQDIVGQTYGPVEMPIRYLKESFADRISASKIYLKKDYNSSAPLEYFFKADKHSNLFPTTKKVLYIWLTWLKIKGEKETLKLVKKIKKYEDMQKYEGEEENEN